jgi:PAS domain S-box-containing protein
MSMVTRYGQVGGQRAELAAILASTHDAVVGATRRGVISRWNPAATELYGYAVEEIIGQPAQLLVPPERHHEEAEVLRRIGQGEPAEEYHTTRLRKDGSPIAVSLTTSAIVEAGLVIGTMRVSRSLGEPPAAPDRFDENVGAHTAQPHAYTEQLQSQLQQAQRLQVLARLVEKARARGPAPVHRP